MTNSETPPQGDVTGDDAEYPTMRLDVRILADWLVITSPDQPGLHVGSPDWAKAMADVIPVSRVLAEMNKEKCFFEMPPKGDVAGDVSGEPTETSSRAAKPASNSVSDEAGRVVREHCEAPTSDASSTKASQDGASLTPVPSPDATGVKPGLMPLTDAELADLWLFLSSTVICETTLFERLQQCAAAVADLRSRRAPPSPQVTREGEWDDLVTRAMNCADACQGEPAESAEHPTTVIRELVAAITAANEQIAGMSESLAVAHDDISKANIRARTAEASLAERDTETKYWQGRALDHAQAIDKIRIELAERDATIVGLREQNERDHCVAVETITGVHNEAKALLETAVRVGIEAAAKYVSEQGRILQSAVPADSIAQQRIDRELVLLLPVYVNNIRALDVEAIVAQITSVK